MTNLYTGLVVSALRKCQLLLQLSGESALQNRALQEAALFQLWKAYKAYLAELANELQLGFEPESLQVVLDSLKSRGVVSSEARELSLLYADPDSWLSKLLQCWRKLQQYAPTPTMESARKGANLIPLCSMASPTSGALSAEILLKWHGALSELVRRQRASLEEC
ncbi:DUF6586 family protein [Microbulbifer spongiae]|uniref:TIGR02444 family protein n=1 Tax=Microbulbifer spongiae TaxID=2944933 RepID=A0ABY9EED7_9GAMM|nr:DUF6586 family protein [Microbulbifer sp. MI-G]WKD51330.1 hypothetical protein M8T91_07900 [Microbulbifer sp. MI-G]